MRYIFMMAMLVTMLFAQQQKQIILGSFSIESNALFYSIDVQKNVDNNPELKKLIQKYSLKVEYKKVGAYNVVSICPFDNYPSLFVTMAEVKKHYPAAYPINFPAFANKTMNAEPIEEDSVEEPLKEIEEELAEDAVEPREEAFEEDMQEQEEEIKYEPQKMTNPIALPIVEMESEESLIMSDLILLIALLLVVIAFVLYKIKMKKKEEEH